MQYVELHQVSQQKASKKHSMSRPIEQLNLAAGKRSIIGIRAKETKARTALIHILSGVSIPASGSYFIDTLPLPYQSDKQMAAFRNSNIGSVSYSFPLIPKWNVIENVSFPLNYSSRCGQSRLEAIALKALKFVKLHDTAKRELWTLTSGEELRIKIARAIVNMPKVVIAEISLEELNKSQADPVIDIISNLPALDITTILLTEDPELEKICSRQYELLENTLVETKGMKHYPV
jgi:ABC-type lipoprotein export system ATPase subunit